MRGKTANMHWIRLKLWFWTEVSDRVPGYVDSIKASIAQSPMLRGYNENPYINA